MTGEFSGCQKITEGQSCSGMWSAVGTERGKTENWSLNFPLFDNFPRFYIIIIFLEQKKLQKSESDERIRCIWTVESHQNEVKNVYLFCKFAIAMRLLLKRSLFTQMKDINHQNVNTFIGACIDPGNICILTQYCNKGSLQVKLELLWNDKLSAYLALNWVLRSYFFRPKKVHSFHNWIFFRMCCIMTAWSWIGFFRCPFHQTLQRCVQFLVLQSVWCSINLTIFIF